MAGGGSVSDPLLLLLLLLHSHCTADMDIAPSRQPGRRGRPWPKSDSTRRPAQLLSAAASCSISRVISVPTQAALLACSARQLRPEPQPMSASTGVTPSCGHGEVGDVLLWIVQPNPCGLGTLLCSDAPAYQLQATHRQGQQCDGQGCHVMLQPSILQRARLGRPIGVR